MHANEMIGRSHEMPSGETAKHERPVHASSPSCDGGALCVRGVGLRT